MAAFSAASSSHPVAFLLISISFARNSKKETVSNLFTCISNSLSRVNERILHYLLLGLYVDPINQCQELYE